MQMICSKEPWDAVSATWEGRYADQKAAGREIAGKLLQYRGERAVVLALPPGGVAIASEVARALRLPLDVLVARPFAIRAYPTLTAGAVCEGGGLCLNAALLRLPASSLEAIWREVRKTYQEITDLARSYRHGRPLPMICRRPVILVDDGLGSGLVQLAALQALRRYHPQQRIIATPGGTAAVKQLIARRADGLITLRNADDADYNQHRQWRTSLGDDEAAVLLERSRLRLMAD